MQVGFPGQSTTPSGIGHNKPLVYSTSTAYCKIWWTRHCPKWTKWTKTEMTTMPNFFAKKLNADPFWDKIAEFVQFPQWKAGPKLVDIWQNKECKSAVECKNVAKIFFQKTETLTNISHKKKILAHFYNKNLSHILFTAIATILDYACKYACVWTSCDADVDCILSYLMWIVSWVSWDIFHIIREKNVGPSGGTSTA